MKQRLRFLLDKVLEEMRQKAELPLDVLPTYQLEAPKQAAHGDYSTNVAIILAKPCQRPPRDLATAIAGKLSDLDLFEGVEVAGTGFINFRLSGRELFQVIKTINLEKSAYGRCEIGNGLKIHLEFVSANPTGPLHIGHGRGAAIGSSIANLLEACGFKVCREYYVNDAGRQMDILALSVWYRYLESFDKKIKFPTQAYQGEYIVGIAEQVRSECGEALLPDISEDFFEGNSEDLERALDEMIASAKVILGTDRYAYIHSTAKEILLEEIESDLRCFGVSFDEWFSEKDLSEEGQVEKAIRELDERGHIFEKDGAQWFRSSDFGDEKDRVVVRDNDANTYFAADIAYHQNKFARGYRNVINLWGADHHGYVARLKAAIDALGVDTKNLEILLVQFASLFRSGEKVAMSTRSGDFVTLRQLIQEIGVDAARFFYVMRRSDQHLDFDLDLAVAQTSDNPVYYVQYAHARICSVLTQSLARGFDLAIDIEDPSESLTEASERNLAVLLSRYPDVVMAACLAREPHQITNFLRDLATAFHSYYNVHRVLVEDDSVRKARIMLIMAVKQIVANGLGLLGISAPIKM